MTITVLNKGERMSILSIKNISKFYTLDGKHQEQALKNINLQIAKGKITAIYGPSGCGKTSLLNIISGLDRQYEGDLEFKGESLRDLSEIELTQFRKDKIDREMTMIAKEQLSNLGMEPFIAKNVKQLSGGQKQRVAIARALVNQPDMIVADEPTGSLDSQSQEMVLEVFKNLAQTGKTVLIVTHNPEVAEYADVIIKMKDGEVVEEVKK